jgi:hypothetical protein
MAQDVGQLPPAGAVISQAIPSITPIWYELQVSDPVNPGQRGWAYLVHSGTLAPTFAEDYVDFDEASHRLIGEVYRLGLATPNPWIDYLTLGTSNVDILDRTKIRVFCSIAFLCPLTEEVPVTIADNLVKDGPVRVIVGDGLVLGYGAMISSSAHLTIPQEFYGDARLSTDFAAAASGAIFYNAVVPDGVTVDGTPDAVPGQPVSPWTQLSLDQGSLIQVSDLSGLGGTVSNFYEDDSTFDASDTGDKQRYGEAGFFVADPNLVVDYRFNLYFLPGAQPNRGSEFESYFQQPLEVTAIKISGNQASIYLPLIIRQ